MTLILLSFFQFRVYFFFDWSWVHVAWNLEVTKNQSVPSFWSLKLHVYILKEAPTILASLKIYLGLLVHRGEIYQFSVLLISYSNCSKSADKNLVKSTSVSSFYLQAWVYPPPASPTKFQFPKNRLSFRTSKKHSGEMTN